MRGPWYGFGLNAKGQADEGAGNDVFVVGAGVNANAVLRALQCGLLVGEDVYDAGGDFVVDDGFFFAYDSDTELLAERIKLDFSSEGRGPTTISSDLSLYYISPIGTVNVLDEYLPQISPRTQHSPKKKTAPSSFPPTSPQNTHISQPARCAR